MLKDLLRCSCAPPGLGWCYHKQQHLLSAGCRLGLPSCCGCGLVRGSGGPQEEEGRRLCCYSQPSFEECGRRGGLDWQVPPSGAPSIFPSCSQNDYPRSGRNRSDGPPPPSKATQTLPYPNVLMVLRYPAVAERFLQIENKLSRLKEVTQRTWGQTIFLLRQTHDMAVTAFFISVSCKMQCPSPLYAALPSSSTSVCMLWFCIRWRTLLVISRI